MRGAASTALRAGLRHRALLAAALAAGSVTAGVHAVAPPPAPTREVLAAARDLPWGKVLAAGDVRRLALPVDAVPDGTLTDLAAAEGRLLAAPVRRGEPITDLRLVGPGLLAEVSGDVADDLVAAPVRIADPDAAGLLRAGDVVDVLAAAGGPEPAEVVAPAARVLVVPRREEDGGASSVLAEGALVVLAVPPSTAARLVRAATTSRLSVTVRPT